MKNIPLRSLSEEIRKMIDSGQKEFLYNELKKVKYGIAYRRTVKYFFELKWGENSFDLSKANY